MNDLRRPRPPARPKPAGPLTGPVQLDDATRNALILFNARLEAQEAREKEQRRVDKAAKAKDDAAARVRALDNDPKATAEKKAEAQAAYLAALEAWNRAKAGEPAAPGEAADEAETDEAAGDDAPTDAESGDEPASDEAASDEAASDDAPTDEAAADDAPTDEAPADDAPAATEAPAAGDGEPAEG